MRRRLIAAAALALALAGPAHAAEVLWDSWGVPHIWAKNDKDLFRAVGWATMRNHADLTLRLYGQARGRAAEYWGEGHVESDTQVRTLRIPERAEAALAKQPAAFRARLDAFVDGVNAYAARHPERISPEVRQVLPVRTVDLFAHQQRSGVLPFAFQALKTTVDGWTTRGSNAWAIGPAHSASGKAMLVMNPHIPWGEMVFGGLFRTFEMDLKAPGLDFYGAVQVGSPFPAGGFNDALGWTGTVSTLDDVDVYELTLADGGYRFDGATRAFDASTTTLKVRRPDGGLDERTIPVRWSVHGPVIAEKDGKALAVRLAGIDAPLLALQYWEMARSRSWPQFRKALGRMQMPKSNLLYADRDGHIFYLAAGQIPARRDGDYAFWGGILPGDTSRTLWTSTLPIDALPQTFDPPAGWLQNANEPPWYVTDPPAFRPEQFPAWMSPRSLGLRPQRSLRMMTERPTVSFEQMRDYKLSTRSELADRVLDDLVAAARAGGSTKAREAAEVLAGWDRQAETDSRGAVLFFAWSAKFLAAPKAWRTPWSAEHPRATPAGLADPAAAVALLEQAAAETEKAWGRLDVAFGEVYRLRWKGGIDLPANGAPGQYGVFRVTDYLPEPDGRKKAFQGDTYVILAEFSQPVRAEAVLSYGNASQPGSKHDGDQLRLYSEKKMRAVWRTRAEVEANLEEREVTP